ncbi:MAG: ABC transporter ATP-binding protein [Symploca sp. SIO2E6]|nr:ABC transporter ATP-binding protein [Symploca sp. SIO2E6]
MKVEALAIQISGLSFSYPNQPPVLQDISFTIQPGERVGLIGPNGAGKSTLFLSICGILQPTTGEILLFGKPVVKGEFRPEIGLVFQNPNDQLFCPSVWDDVAFGPENLGLSPAEIEHRVEEAFAVTGIQKLAERVPHHLSGGEKCMVAIAGVLALQPQLVLYDEPSANLDLPSRRRLIDFLREAEPTPNPSKEGNRRQNPPLTPPRRGTGGRRQEGSTQETIIISSHDLELIIEVCDRVLLLDEGKILADGHPTEIIGNGEWGIGNWE